MEMVIGNDLVGLLKHPPFQINKFGDPEQLLQDWTKYGKKFKHFLSVTKDYGRHSEGQVDCGGCSISEIMLLMFGQ